DPPVVEPVLLGGERLTVDGHREDLTDGVFAGEPERARSFVARTAARPAVPPPLEPGVVVDGDADRAGAVPGPARPDRDLTLAGPLPAGPWVQHVGRRLEPHVHVERVDVAV